MTLYEIDQAILACIDEESGEIIDADALKGGEQIPGAELVTNLNPQIK